MPFVHEGMTESQHRLLGLALGDPSVTRAVAGIDPHRRRYDGMDPEQHALIALAALVAVGGTEVSFGSAIEAAFAVGADPEDIAGVLFALAPVVGVARAQDAADRIVQALGSDPDVQRTFARILRAGPVPGRGDPSARSGQPR